MSPKFLHKKFQASNSWHCSKVIEHSFRCPFFAVAKCLKQHLQIVKCVFSSCPGQFGKFEWIVWDWECWSRNPDTQTIHMDEDEEEDDQVKVKQAVLGCLNLYEKNLYSKCKRQKLESHIKTKRTKKPKTIEQIRKKTFSSKIVISAFLLSGLWKVWVGWNVTMSKLKSQPTHPMAIRNLHQLSIMCGKRGWFHFNFNFLLIPHP